MKMKKEKKKKEIAIKVKDLSKTFKIPHEKNNTVRSVFVNIFKRNGYEEFKALDDVSFEVKKGEFFGIIGRNGSGKSTLLKILAGIYEQDTGGVEVNGRISPFLELGVGFNPELSGRDNIYLNGTVLGLTKKQIDEKFDSIVKFSELERFIDQKLKNYSSGMSVRLAFSVSIHANRDILLMDEVLAVGDSNFQSKCLSEFNKYRELGKTVVLVTHSVEVIRKYCDNAMLLRNGRLLKIGKAESIANAYINQNISDEESRVLEVERDKDKNKNKGKSKISKGPARKNMGSKKIEIKSVKVLDCKEKERKVFASNAKVIFRIEYCVARDFNLENLVFGLGIHLEDNGQYCFALNSFIDKVILSQKLVGRGFLEIEVPRLILNEGSYFINAIVSRDIIDVNRPIHFIGKIGSFKIKNVNYDEGLFSIKHSWR